MTTINSDHDWSPDATAANERPVVTPGTSPQPAATKLYAEATGAEGAPATGAEASVTGDIGSAIDIKSKAAPGDYADL